MEQKLCYILSIIYIVRMKGKFDSECQICSRLGKKECGYHHFKNQSLSKMSNYSINHQLSQTQSTILNRHQEESIKRNITPLNIQPRQINHQQQSMITPEKGKGQNISFNYIQQQTPSPLRQTPINYHNTMDRQVHHRTHTPQKIQRMIHSIQSNGNVIGNGHRAMEMPQQMMTVGDNVRHMVRIENNQMVYYPIYPVYEVIYEPVEPINQNSYLRY